MLRWPPLLTVTAAVSLLSMLPCLAVPAAMAAEADGGTHFGADWLDLSQWRPSIGISFGVAYRSVDGAVDGQVWTADGDPPADVFLVDTADTEKWPNTDVVIDLSGPTIPLDFQLMTPAFEGLPSKPRLFVEGGYIINLHKDKVAGNAGAEPADFGIPKYPQGGVRQIIDQQNSWYLGLGAAFELPIERYKTRLGVSVRYHQDSMTVDRRMEFFDDLEPDGVFTQSDSITHVVHEVSPGVSLEMDLDKRGPILIGVYMDTYFGIPIDDAPETQTLDNESRYGRGDSMTYSFSSDNVRYQGSVGLRFTWVGM